MTNAAGPFEGNHGFGALVADRSLHRILGGHDLAGVVELWVLQTSNGDARDSRLLYGRVLPYDHASGQWSCPAEDRFKKVREGLRAQCVRVTLHATCRRIVELIAKMAIGETLAASSERAQLSMSTDFASRFGALTLSPPLTIRPSMHLPARDYFRHFTRRLSPLDGISCDSAAIGSMAKPGIFDVDDREDRELAKFAIDSLDAHTGLQFASLDAWRLGDLELLVLPAMTETGGAIVDLRQCTIGLEVRVERPLVDAQHRYRVHARFMNDSAVCQTAEAWIAAGVAYPATVLLAWTPTTKAIRDAMLIEIEAVDVQTGACRLCYQRGMFLIREISQTMHLSAGRADFASDWVSMALSPSHQGRLEQVQKIARATWVSESMVGGRWDDPWVTANRHAASIAKDLLPPKSEGRFFLRYSEGDHTGRLQLVEWIQRLLANHRDRHIAWFDPYMEDIGIHMLNAHGSDSGSYTVFTGTGRQDSTPWWEHVIAWTMGDAPPDDGPDRRIRNLQAACKAWSDQYATVRLSVFGLPQDELHDRMVLVRDARMRPVVGYHLSNSLQKANENHPLLITPIPPDVLHDVVRYVDALLRSEALTGARSGDSEQGSGRLTCLFDSRAQAASRPPYVPTDPIETERAGEVLDWWLASSDLAPLEPAALRGRLHAQGLLHDERLRHPTFDALPARFWQEGLNLPDFDSAWIALGAILCNTMAGDTIHESQRPSLPPLRDNLLHFLDADRLDAVQPPPRRSTVDMTSQLQRGLADLMKQVADPQQLFPHDVTEVSWGDYYALQILWATDPEALVQWIEAGADERWRANRRRQLGLKCATRLISFEIARSCSPRQLCALLRSHNALLRWIGYVAFEAVVHEDLQALTPSGATSVLAPEDRLDLLAWLAARAARSSATARHDVMATLHASLPPVVGDSTLRRLVDSMRNVLGKVYDSPPWMLQEALMPLAQSARVEIDSVAAVWFDELMNEWKGDDTFSVLFRAEEEGRFTDEVAALCAAASEQARERAMVSTRKEIKRHTQIVQRPLAAQLNWAAYDRSFKKLLWIAAFLRAWLEKSPGFSEVEHALSQTESTLARRSTADWACGTVSDLMAYYQGHA